jgi:4-diphosphocytidyl-2-C-methyl-D-erythritol kinase
MADSLILEAPAKVNLHLEILKRRPDGFHEILSILQAISLFDRIRIRSLKQTGIVRILCNPPLAGERNLVGAAVELFRNSFECRGGVEVLVDKQIPVGGGLGGGSSDAASVLLGLNRLYGEVFGSGDLRALAARLGSDVPFFLGGAAALAFGCGELLRQLAPRQDFELLLIYPGFPVLTGEAYRWYDERQVVGTGQRRSRAELEAEYLHAPVSTWRFSNSFQPVVENRHPVLAEIARKLESTGAHSARISGSGSSIFGIYSDLKAARKAQGSLAGSYPLVRTVTPLH